MEEFFKLLLDILQSGDADAKFENVKIEEDENGNVHAWVEAPKPNEDIVAIKAELDEMDDDIFKDAALLLRQGHPEVYKVLETLDDDKQDVPAIKRAYSVFRQCVAEVVEGKIKSMTAEVNRLFTKYLDKKVKA